MFIKIENMENRKYHYKLLLALSVLIYLVYTLPTIYLGIRDGFFGPKGETIITVWGGIMTLITIFCDFNMIRELKKD